MYSCSYAKNNYITFSIYLSYFNNIIRFRRLKLKNIIDKTSIDYKDSVENNNIENTSFYETMTYSFYNNDSDYYFYPFFNNSSYNNTNHKSYHWL